MFTIKSKYDILKIVNTAKEEKEDPKMKRKRTHTILATITLISVILTSACTADNANSTLSSAPETAVTTTTAPAVTGTVMDRIDEPKAETTTAQTTTAVTTKPQETKKVETTAAATAVTTAKPKPATTTTAATTKPAPEWTETKASGTKYVNTDCYSRKKAVLGAETVKLYSVNDKVTVTAKTDTGYYKLSDGSFIHSDYLSDSKIVIQTTTTAKKAETPKPATTTKKQESKPAETKWKFTKSDCEYIIEECYKWADKNGYKYKRVNEIKYPNGGYWDYSNGEEVWVDVKRNCQYGEVYKNSSWDTTYKTVGHPYFWGSARNEQVINKNEEIISTITFMCNDIKYYNEEGYTPVLDFTSYSEFVSYTKDRPGFIGCSNLVDDGTIDYILFVIYGA